ncbi:MAG: folylpolyglutamate synthase/dihydrofolate synthase family protein [Candidatus Omnitrophota bacterium]|nr:folylpolyglutamate synthase/dihydrofolate synthase family protein [Candidatus Omnitrophota bacterium]
MTYREALKYLDSFVNFEKSDGYDYRASFKLERMKRFAALLGDPQESVRSIHIAGSKGKGSTASYVHSILGAAGFKTGLYTSPHLVSFRERIRIGDELVSEDDLARILARIKDVVESSMKDRQPTFFEIYTALAYIYFEEKKADFAVYEAGLGGRLDATNLVEPLVSAITPLSYEHTDKLGDTLTEIAIEKCGIIKTGGVSVSAPQEEEALKVIEDTCRERKTRLIIIGRDIKFKGSASDEDSSTFDVSGPCGEYKNLKTSLIGAHQVVNAATAIGIVEALRLQNVIIPERAVRCGIRHAKWPGRLEVIDREPFVLLDGAHNKASARILIEAVKKIFKYRRLVLVLGVSKDKDVKGILEELLPEAGAVILTKSKVSSRALDPVEIREKILNTKHDIKDVILTHNTEEALNTALTMACPEDLVLITGSLFIVGEAKEHYQKCENTA